jgi:hypothetical protein
MVDPDPDFASAALRHIRDAEHLTVSEEHRSLDQAWHLAGFAHECARKACLDGDWVHRLLGHDFTPANEEVIDIAIALDPRAGRYPVRDWPTRYTSIERWNPNHRYERTGTAELEGLRKIDALVSEGRRAVDECLLELFLDGRLDMESVR